MTNVEALIDIPTLPGFEKRLAQNLQPIRGFALAACLYHLFDLGIADAILADSGQAIGRLASNLNLDPRRFESFLQFLQVEGFVAIEGDAVTARDQLADMREAWPWYEMLIGGYAQTYLAIGEGLRKGSGPLPRNGARVGSGSCKISHYDAIPLTKNLLARMPQAPRKIVDLGCGNALYLKELCSMFADLTAIGVEPDADGHMQSVARLDFDTYGGRIRLVNATAQHFIETTQEEGIDAFVIAFVLQEILGQDGRHGAVDFLRQVVSKFPNAHIVVIEVEDKAGDTAAMSHPLAQAYYNPYFLVHPFTNQVLKETDFWLELLEQAGLRLLARGTTDPSVDSTGFERGFLLACG